MPKWIHNRAEHLLAKNPDMKKSTAFAVATQQSHALGKTPKSYGTAEGKRTAKAKFDTPKDDVKAANPGKLESPKMAGAVMTMKAAAGKEKDSMGTALLERAAASRGFKPGTLPIIKQIDTAKKLIGPEAAHSKTHALVDFLKSQPKGGTPMPSNVLPPTPAMPGAAKIVTAAAERMKLAFAKMSAEKSDVETKGSIDNNVDDTIKGTEHSQQGAGEQKGVPTEGYHWGQDPKNGTPDIGHRSSSHETFTDGAEEINVADNHDLLHRIFANMGPASNTAKATIEQNFAHGRRGNYVTHSQTLLEKVRSVAGRL